MHGYPGPQSANHQVVVGGAILQLLRSGRQGQKHFGHRRILHALGQDTDHGVRLSVEVDGTAQHGPIRTEMLLPEWVAEHRDGVVSRLTFAILIDAT